MARTIHQIRLDNLQRLHQEAGGNLTTLARQAKTARNHLSALLNGTKTKDGATRGVGDRLARKLEAATGKPEGWMDADHSSSHVNGSDHAAHNVESRLLPHEIDLLLMFRALSVERQGDVLGSD